MKRIAWILVLIAIPLTATAAGPDYDRNGIYVGIDGVAAIELFDDGPLNFDNGGGVKVRAGYRWAPEFAVEGVYEWAGGFDDPIGFAAKGWSLTLNSKGYFATGRVQPYAVAGLGGGQSEISLLGVSATAGAFIMRFGGGLDYYLTEHWVVDTEIVYVLPFGNLKGTDYLSLGFGFQYRF
jgi:opacity protein-like surface antigen